MFSEEELERIKEIIALFNSGALEVSSISVGRDQIAEVSLVGSLRRPTQMEKIMNQIGKCSFEEVIQAILKGVK